MILPHRARLNSLLVLSRDFSRWHLNKIEYYGPKTIMKGGNEQSDIPETTNAKFFMFSCLASGVLFALRHRKRPWIMKWKEWTKHYNPSHKRSIASIFVS